jgi:predicted HNH restriction endonuclease
MGRKLPHTPLSQIKSALRTVWLRSRERAAALKREKYCCERCGIKQSMAKGRVVKVVVHHRKGIDWGDVVQQVRARMLPDPSELEVLCVDCHKKEHPGKKQHESGAS